MRKRVAELQYKISIINGILVMFPFSWDEPRIFVSHRWALESDYSSACRLFERIGYRFWDNSVQSYRRIKTTDKQEIEDTIRFRIKDSNLFIIFDDAEVVRSEWCMFELRIATQLRMPVVVVDPKRSRSNLTCRIPYDFETIPLLNFSSEFMDSLIQTKLENLFRWR